MANCPSCQSTRLRAGYRPVALPLRLLGIRELLCDDCNYLYRAFSPLPPRSGRRRNPGAKADTFVPAQSSGAVINGDGILVRHKKPEPAVKASQNPQSAPPEPRPVQPKKPLVVEPVRFDPAKQAEVRIRSLSSPECLHCGSNDTKRRSRKVWERVVYARSPKRPYICNGCGKSFYAVKRTKG